MPIAQLLLEYGRLKILETPQLCMIQTVTKIQSFISQATPFLPIKNTNAGMHSQLAYVHYLAK